MRCILEMMKAFGWLLMLAASASVGQSQTPSPCDVNGGGSTNMADVRTVVKSALGASPVAADLNNDGTVNVTDVQIVIDAVLGKGCEANGATTYSLTVVN